MAVTPRLALYKPDGNDLVDVTAHLSGQLDIIDNAAARTLVSNLASPPVASFIGQEWFTKDTKQFFFWNGTIWQEIPFPTPVLSTGSGRKAFTVGTWTTNQFSTGPSAENGPLLQTTINTYANKQYNIIVHVNVKALDSTDSPKCYVRLRAASGSSVSTSGTLVHSVKVGIRTYIASDQEKGTACFQGTYLSPTDQQTTFGVFIAKSSGMTGNMAFLATNATPANHQFMFIEEM